jgi:phage shock protein C
LNAPIKRLYRSRKDRKIAGVCGGLAEYFGWDPVLPRILLLVFILGAGVGLLAYIICWIVIPLEPAA